MEEDISGSLFIISAPSGAGKTSLTKEVLAKIGACHSISQVITYTSKKPRIGEVPGKDYHFIDKVEFERLIKEQFFLEWSCAYEHYYGTPSSIISHLQAGKSLILIIDRVGVQRIIQKIPSAILIWIAVSDIKVLEARLKERNTESQEQIFKRLARATQEIALEKENPIYHHYIRNDSFEQAVYELESLIVKKLKSIE